MIKLFTTQDFDNTKSKDILYLRCNNCAKPFHAIKSQIQAAEKNNSKKIKLLFCSRECSSIYSRKRIEFFCQQCGNKSIQCTRAFTKSLNHFCSRSCSVTYNNTHKTTGTRRSKLEIYFEAQLQSSYSTLEFHFNRKDTINSELDIYIPSLKLAFELNGIFHYEPIYGSEKLNQIQNNDNRKSQACLEKGIELCIIDTSQFLNFKEERALKYLEIIENIINSKLSTI